jgi:hypothetical protein
MAGDASNSKLPSIEMDVLVMRFLPRSLPISGYGDPA